MSALFFFHARTAEYISPPLFFETFYISLFDGGYLNDPESEFGGIYNPDVVSLESIES